MPWRSRPRPSGGFTAALPPFLAVSNRVRGMLMINVLAVVAGLLMGVCRIWKPHIMIISGRFIMGFYCGTSDTIIITISSEENLSREIRSSCVCSRVVVGISAHVHW